MQCSKVNDLPADKKEDMLDGNISMYEKSEHEKWVQRRVEKEQYIAIHLFIPCFENIIAY